jgi:hypothetical protein
MPMPTRAAIDPGAPPGGWRVPVATACAWSALAALLMSLQFLTQRWLWINWPPDEVLTAWLYQLRNHLVVAAAIALAVSAGSSLPVTSLGGRVLLLAAAIVAGALVGETAMRAIDDAPHDALGRVAARWSLQALVLAGMVYLWRHESEVRARWQAETLAGVRRQQQSAAAQLAALKHQIEPHFLFNTLATVRRLQRTEQPAGAQMLASFVEYLRRTLPLLDRPSVPLAQELALLRAYLDIVTVRMSGRLVVAFDIDDASQAAEVPPLVVATLVENAIRHGLTPAPAGGRLTIRARAEATRFEIVVEDTGVGLGAGASGGSGIGLANARARLRTLHGGAATLRLERNQPSGVRAVVVLPRPAADGR